MPIHRARLRLEELECRLVLNGAGLHALPAPIFGPMAVHAAPLVTGSNALEQREIIVAAKSAFVHLQGAAQSVLDSLPSASSMPNQGELTPFPVGTPIDAHAEEIRLIETFVLFMPQPFGEHFFGHFGGDNVGGILPTAGIQHGIAEHSENSSTVKSGAEIAHGTGLEHAQPVPMTSLKLHQADLFVQIVLTDATPAVPQRTDGAEIEASADRGDGEALQESTTPTPPLSFALEGAGLLTGGMPAGFATLERAVRELLGVEPKADDGDPPCLRWLGLGGWVVSAALAYVVARERFERTTDFDDLSALGDIGLRNKDRQ